MLAEPVDQNAMSFISGMMTSHNSMIYHIIHLIIRRLYISNFLNFDFKMLNQLIMI